MKLKLFFLIIFLILLNCKPSKDSPIYPVKQEQRFIVDNTSEKLINTYEPPLELIAEEHLIIELTMDVDNDESNDFLLISSYNETWEDIQIRQLRIYPFDESTEIATFTKSDTLFQCVDSSYVYPDSLYTYQYFSHDSIYECQTPDIKKLLQVHSNLYPEIYNEGDTIQENIEWSNQLVQVAYMDSSRYHIFEGIAIYTVIREIYWGPWINGQSHYIVFRKKIDGIYKYGWINMSCLEYWGVRIYATAIEN